MGERVRNQFRAPAKTNYPMGSTSDILQLSTTRQATMRKQSTTGCAILHAPKARKGEHALTEYSISFRFFFNPSNAGISPVKPTNAEMEQQLMTCRKRERHTAQKWRSSISKPRILSSGRTMPMGGSQMTRLTFMASLSRRQKISWRSGSNMRGTVAKRIFMCMFTRMDILGWN